MSKVHSTREAVQYSLRFVKGNVLDAGGGPAAKYRTLLKTRAETYTCLDAQQGGHVDVVGDILNMPFQENAFDTVVCNQVIEHVSQPRRLIAEAFRVLKPTGYFICTAPFLEPIHADPGDFFRYTEEGLRSLCQAEGFEVIETKRYGGFFSVMASFIKFSWFDPYQPATRIKKSLSRYILSACATIDTLITPDRIYSDVLLIAQKK